MVAGRPAARSGTAAEAVFLRACRGEEVERTPVWIMRQAGRYLPEYRAVRERHEFLVCCRTPELACEITLQPVRRLGVDAAILFSDILVPLPGMGIDVRFEPGPRLERAIRSEADVATLRVPDARDSTPYVFDAIRLLRRELPPDVPLIGFAGAPFTMAAYLVEGGGSRTFTTLRHLLFTEPATAHRLLAVCTHTVSSYLTEQVRAGAQAAMLFDTWAGLLSPADVRQFALPYARRVLDAVRSLDGADGAVVPTIYYAGESAGWVEACREAGADVIGIDWRLGLDAARARVGGDVVLQGNLDPAVLLGTPALIRERVRAVLEQGSGQTAELKFGPTSGGATTGGPTTGGPTTGGPTTGGPTTAGPMGARPRTGHIFNLGHGILPETPPDHARLVVDTVRELSGRTS
jgi:uroporphyrinogen decarboxylase